MKASARILITATTLAALTMLGLATTATASVPQRPEGSQQPATTVEPTTVPQPGHGAQLHHDAAPATATPSSTERTASADVAFAPSIPALAVVLLGLLLALARGDLALAAASTTSSRLTVPAHVLRGCRAHPVAPSARPVQILSSADES